MKLERLRAIRTLGGHVKYRTHHKLHHSPIKHKCSHMKIPTFIHRNIDICFRMRSRRVISPCSEGSRSPVPPASSSAFLSPVKTLLTVDTADPLREWPWVPCRCEDDLYPLQDNHVYSQPQVSVGWKWHTGYFWGGGWKWGGGTDRALHSVV